MRTKTFYRYVANTVSAVISTSRSTQADLLTVEERAGAFQVRPHREFVPDKGRNKMLSLAIFQSASGLDTSSTHSDLASDHRSRSSNAYEFMQRRRRESGDPAVQQQQATIRMANYAHSDIPLCVSVYVRNLPHKLTYRI